MKIHTKYFGMVEINPAKMITFSKGIPSFETVKEYTILDLSDNNTFHCLQSIKHPEIAFFLITPWDFFPDYDINISQEDLEDLNITKIEQVAIYNIVTIPQDPKKITANLLGPIVINRETLQAKQVILSQENYHTKHLLISEEREEV